MDDPGSLASLPSLRVTYIIPGDIMYFPCASLICEKALGTGNCIALRVSTCLLSTGQALQAQYMRRVLGEYLVGNWKVFQLKFCTHTTPILHRKISLAQHSSAQLLFQPMQFDLFTSRSSSHRDILLVLRSVGAKIYLDFMSKVKQEQADGDATNSSAVPAVAMALPVAGIATASKPEHSDDHCILALIESLLCNLASKDEQTEEGFDEEIAVQKAVELAPKHSLHPAFTAYIKSELALGDEWEWGDWEGDILEDLKGFVDFVHLRMSASHMPTSINGDDGSHVQNNPDIEPATSCVEEKPEETTGTGGPNDPKQTTDENQNEATEDQQPEIATKASETVTTAPVEPVVNHEAEARDLETGFAQSFGIQKHGESFVEAGVAMPSLPAPTGKLETEGTHVLPPNLPAPTSMQAKAEEKLEDTSNVPSPNLPELTSTQTARAEEKLEAKSSASASLPAAAPMPPTLAANVQAADTRENPARRLTGKSAPEEKRIEENKTDKPAKRKGEGKATSQIEKEADHDQKKAKKAAKVGWISGGVIQQ